MMRCGLIGAMFILVGSSMLSAAEDQFFDSAGVKIRYQVEGKGEPVLLIHGFTGSIEGQWVMPGVTKALVNDYQVISLDNRGHGKSGKPHDVKQYGMNMVEDSIRLLDHLKIKKAHIVGYSMGAMITCKLMTEHSDRCLSATLGGAAGLREGTDMRFFDLLGESLEKGKGFGLLIAALTPDGEPKPSEDRMKAINIMLSATNDTKALGAVARSWRELINSDDKLKANKVPALALIGSKDPLKKNVDEFKPFLANVQTTVIEGGDHITTFAKPEFVQGLKEFLAKNGNGGKK